MLLKRPMTFYANRKGAGCMNGLVIHRLHADYPVKGIQPKHTLSMALLRRSLRRQGGEGQGVLYCHPVQQTDVATWLCQHAHLGWRLEIDARLILGEVRLKTEGGVFTLKW